MSVRIVSERERTPEEERKAHAVQEALGQLRVANPLAFYTPHPKQATFHEATTHIKAFLGGNQSGKTTAGVADDLIQAVDRELLEKMAPNLLAYKRFDPPFLGRIVTPDFTATMEGVVFQKLKELVPASQLLGGGWDKAYDKALRKLRFANGSSFDFLTYEQDLDKFGGATLDRVHFDEEPPGEKGRQIYLQARSRVMARGGDLLFTQTPEFGMSWMFDEIYERRDEEDVTVVQVSTDDNVFLPKGAAEKAFERLSDEEQAYKRHGRFVAFGGLVVDLEDRHKVDSVTREHVRGLDTIYCIIDPGAAQGAVLWVGFDKDDVMLAFDELYPAGNPATLVENVVKQIREVNDYWGIDPYMLIDPSARNRNTDGGDGVEAEYWNHGIYPVKAHNDRFHSVMQLRRRVAAKLGKDETPGLLVNREKCPKLLWELGRWRVAEDERTSQDKVKRGQTGDTFATTGPDHLGDCARYGALQRIWGPDTGGKPTSKRAWTPGTAPGADWFVGRAPTDAPPMGAFS